MLPLAILLLLAAVGLLLAAIVTGQDTLAWGSVGGSAVLAVVLLALSRRSWRRRRDAAAAEADAALADEEPAVAEQDSVAKKDADEDAGTKGADEDAGRELAEQEGATPDVAGQPGPQPQETPAAPAAEPTASDGTPGPEKPGDDLGHTAAGGTGRGDADDEAEPDEEDTDAADLLVVWDLTDEVLVVDEHPRYHLARCSWPAGGQTEPLPVREARELGFTPCALCRPDASLARRRRAANARQDAAQGDQDPAHTDADEADPGQEAVATGSTRNGVAGSAEVATSEAANER